MLNKNVEQDVSTLWKMIRIISKFVNENTLLDWPTNHGKKKEMEREENSKEVEAENAISSLPLLLPRNANWLAASFENTRASFPLLPSPNPVFSLISVTKFVLRATAWFHGRKTSPEVTRRRRGRGPCFPTRRGTRRLLTVSPAEGGAGGRRINNKFRFKKTQGDDGERGKQSETVCVYGSARA